MTDGYWFDATPLAGEPEQPRRPAAEQLRGELSGARSLKGRLAALRNADLGDLLKERMALPREQIELFAEANGLGYRGWQRKSTHILPSDDPEMYRPGVIFNKYSGQCNDIVSWAGAPYVEFANMDSSATDAADATGWGYVGFRHGLDLPAFILDARANDAEKPNHAGRVVTSLTEHSKMSSPALSLTQQPIVAVQVGEQADAAFQMYAEESRAEEATALVRGPFLEAALAATGALDVECVGGWVFLYGYGIEFCTKGAERWAWIFSLASRWIDALQPLIGASASERPPFYTPTPFPKPDSVTIVRPDALFNNVVNELYWWGL